jgi:cyanophycin synthetase
MNDLIKSVNIISIKYLNGPNLWMMKTPCMEVLIDIGDFENYPSNKINNLYDNIVMTFPFIVNHECGIGEKGGFLTRLKNGTYFAHILEHIILEIQSFSGFVGGKGRTRGTERTGIYKMVVSMGYNCKELVTESFNYGLEILLLLIQNKKVNLYNYFDKIKKISHQYGFGRSIYEVIKKLPKSIPYFKINNDYDLIQLGYGKQQKKLWTSTSPFTTGISESIVENKNLTKKLLREQNISVPRGDITNNIKDIYKIIEKIGYPVVIKPINSNQSDGVTLNITSPNVLEQAFSYAVKNNKSGEKNIIVEKYHTGFMYRILIIKNKIIACSNGELGKINDILLGDGISTINDLINNKRPNRFLELQTKDIEDEKNNIMNEKIIFEEKGDLFFKDLLLKEYLNKNNIKLNQILKKDQKITIEKIYDCYTTIDIDTIHNHIKEQCLLATRIVDLDICGVDLIIKNINEPLTPNNGVILELNSGPNLYIHKNSKISVTDELIKYLFKDDLNGYIPIISIVGNGNQTFVSKFISSFFIKLGKYVGSYGKNGYFLNNKKIDIYNQYNWEYVKQILLNTFVEIAIFDNDSNQILTEGLFYNKCNSIVLGNVNTEIPTKGIQNKNYECLLNEPDNSVKILRVSVDCVGKDGYAILNSDDYNAKDLETICDGKVIYYTVSNNINATYKFVFIKDNFVCLSFSDKIIKLIDINTLVNIQNVNNVKINDILATIGGIWSYYDIFDEKYSIIFNDLINNYK